MKDTNHMLDTIDDLSNSHLCPDSVLVSCDILIIFPSIDTQMGINFLIKFLHEQVCEAPPTQCIIEAL